MRRAMFTEIVEAAGLHGRRLILDVRLNWYRSLPLSCVERLEVTLDGQPAVPDVLEVAGRSHSVIDLPAEDDTWWCVWDTARLTATLAKVPAPGSHRVQFVIGTRVPNLVLEPNRPLVVVDRADVEVSS